MKKLTQRLLVFFIGMPAIFFLVFSLPFYRHLPLNIVIILISAIAAMEFSAMLVKKGISISKIEAFILGSLAPLSAALYISFNIGKWIIPLILTAGALWALLSRIFSGLDDLDNVINHIAGCFSVMAYPGFFMSWIIQMNIWNNSGVIFLFLLIALFNDASAWFFGMILGKNNRGIIPASPNKSIAGFIGGLVTAVVISTGAFYLFPSVLSISQTENTSVLLLKSILLGLLTGFFASVGDLAESAIKRSCDFKDSGNIILGRGGMLDSIDSLSAAAPVFFFIYNLFFFLPV